MAKARVRPPWYQRMKRTKKLLTKLREIIRAWPADGGSTVDAEQSVVEAFEKWKRDMKELPGG